MQLESPLRTVTPTVDGDVLTVLARADASFTAPKVREILQQHSVAGVRNALNRLVEQGVVDAERVGHAFTYRLNREHLAARPIIELATLRTELFGRIEHHVESWSPRPLLVMLFGSAATGSMRVDSDIDLFVVGDDQDLDSEAWQARVGELERVVTRWTGNDARVLQYGVSDLEQPDDRVLDDVRRDGIVISGERSILGRGLNRST